MATRRLIGTGCTLLVVVLAAPATAAAHLRTGTVAVDYRASISSSRLSDAYSATVYQSDRALRLTVLAGHAVAVLGYLGEPFLRIAAGGVSVSTASPTASATGLIPKGDATSGATAWRLLHRGSSVVWHDARVQRLPPGVSRARWRVPIVVDGRRAALGGEVWRIPPPELWPWLLAAALASVLAVAVAARAGQRRLQLLSVALGATSVLCALTAAAGLALSAYASSGTWIAGVDEGIFALAGAGVLVWGPRGARAAAGGALGLLGLAVGLSRSAIFLHAVVLSAVPGAASRALVAVAVATGVSAAVCAGLYYARSESSPSSVLSPG